MAIFAGPMGYSLPRSFKADAMTDKGSFGGESLSARRPTSREIIMSASDLTNGHNADISSSGIL